MNPDCNVPRGASEDSPKVGVLGAVKDWVILEMKKSWKTKLLVFAITFLANSARHASIEGWYMNKPEVENDLNISSEWLGLMEPHVAPACVVERGEDLVEGPNPVRHLQSGASQVPHVVHQPLVEVGLSFFGEHGVRSR